MSIAQYFIEDMGIIAWILSTIITVTVEISTNLLMVMTFPNESIRINFVKEVQYGQKFILCISAILLMASKFYH